MSEVREPASIAEHVFSDAGPLAQAIPGYKVRLQQIEMARAVAFARSSAPPTGADALRDVQDVGAPT